MFNTVDSIVKLFCFLLLLLLLLLLLHLLLHLLLVFSPLSLIFLLRFLSSPPFIAPFKNCKIVILYSSLFIRSIIEYLIFMALSELITIE
jgi:hypothetical protein